ncbi:MAG: uracil-DNA glycosylase [Acidiphilium sp. 37-67-22]|nr:MAG: uracil-DNA glycosylase [Acidiphilium sp. 21-66-27]OYW12523.1 MAG: uracil-DNA glycosylase [Acidiphilium sp. 37-67-22]HQT74378.1 uracil-DNA glycosylase [Acidiphilium sp.]
MQSEPPRDCQLCPRLAEFRAANGAAFPGWFNAPVPGFGPRDARLLVVGLAPGLRGANRTGRPFTGDFAGKLLYGTLLKFGLASGVYAERADDGLALRDCRIVNAVRCVPPENRPLPAEISACNPFLKDEIAAMTRLRGILALGGVAHQATLRAFGLRASHARFGHGAMIELPGGIALADSFHVSRLNTNTGRLTAAMFESVVGTLLARIAG